MRQRGLAEVAGVVPLVAQRITFGRPGQDTGRASWGSRSSPTGHSKDSPAQKVLNPNGLDPSNQPQRMVNLNGLDQPRQLKKVVNPNGLDPPDRLKLREKLNLAASEEITGMQNQEIASGGEQSIICTGVRNVQGQEVVSAYTVRADVGSVSVDAIIDTAAEITVISGLVYRRLIPKPRLSGKRRVQMAGKGQASWGNLVGPVSVKPRNGHHLIIPWVICRDQDSIVTVLCNWTTREITVLENTCVGTACKLSGDALNQETEDVHKRNPAIRSCQETPDLPAHLEPL
ncbi:hypothetical protein PoB_006081100 [Plakobranchus ocellatus]|uniref:Peptidase A2 domain-containing protein n=1 Tax=Plakobranchus ocellatus TaxID=259542 RepID=A0AAV4CR76_9GAST|nr:hypothetical protein PoB_006081100 [Plakobranchus ocellatus]